MLLWKIIQFVQETGTAHSVQPKALLQPPNIEPDTCKKSEAASPTRRCYFGTMELEVGNVSLTGLLIIRFSICNALDFSNNSGEKHFANRIAKA